MLDASVDDVRAANPVLHGVERGADLRQHAAMNRAIGEQALDLAGGEPRQQCPALVENARRVRHEHELFRLQRLGELAGDEIGVDVVRLAVPADADRRDHRHEVPRIKELDQLRIDPLDLAHEADVDRLPIVCIAL